MKKEHTIKKYINCSRKYNFEYFLDNEVSNQDSSHEEESENQFSHKKRKRLLKRLLNFIVNTNEQLSIVEHPDFK